MEKKTRRTFLGDIGQIGAAAVVLPQTPLGYQQGRGGGGRGGGAPAMPPAFDLLVSGGRVIDPSQTLSAPRDVAILNGKIARVAENIAPEQARQVLDARGKIVTPGLIDSHGHVFDSMITTSIDPDIVGIPMGVTTIVDCGSSGALNFPGFRKHIIERANTRVRAVLSLSTIGLIVGNEFYVDPSLVNPRATAQMVEQNRDVIVGIKSRINGRGSSLVRDIEIMQLAREAGDAAKVPIMMHWCNEPKCIDSLKAGDIITHPFNPMPNGPNAFGSDGKFADKILPQILEARQRGIIIDFSHGSHMQWSVAEKAASQGFFPDLISTDIHSGNVAPGHVVNLTTTMAKFLLLGMTLDQVIAAVTSTPAKVYSFSERIGTLQEGAVADVSVLDLVNGDVELLDSAREKRIGKQRLVPFATIKGGKVLNARPIS